MSYNRAAIRQLITEAFNDEGLRTLCFDHFPEVYDAFTIGMTKGQMVRLLTDYCQRQGQWAALLARIQAANPTQYDRFEAQLTAARPAQQRQQRRRPPRRRRPDNPYRYLRPVSPAEFLGRWEQVRAIARDLGIENGDSYACIGGRRCGKSSFLTALEHELHRSAPANDRHPILPILIDFQRSFDSVEHVFGFALRAIGRTLASREISVQLDDAWPESLLADSPTISLERFEEALDGLLDRLYETTGGAARVVLLLDEVDATLDRPWHLTLFQRLRTLIYSGGLADDVRLVLAGSRRFLDDVTDRGSPLWNVLQIRYLTAFDEATIHELVDRCPDWAEGIAGAVWQQSGGHPFLAQYLLHHLWQTGVDQVTADTVDSLAHRFLYEESNHLEGWSRAVEAGGLRLYGYLAAQADWVDELALIRHFQHEVVNVKRGLTGLCYHGLVVHQAWQRYRCSGRLFQAWYQQENDRLMADLISAQIPASPTAAVVQAVFDQRYQQVQTQYNAGGDIRFDRVANRREAVAALAALRQAVVIGGETRKTTIEVASKLDQAIEAADSPAVVSSAVLQPLQAARQLAADTAAQAVVAQLDEAIAMAERIF